MTKQEEMIKYYDNLFIEQGEVVIKSWVFEDDTWVYRKLTSSEVRSNLELEAGWRKMEPLER